MPETGIPKAPAWLPRVAKTHWSELAGHLDTMQVLSFADRQALTALCMAYYEYRKNIAYCQKHGFTTLVSSAQGVRVQVRAEWTIASDAWRRWTVQLSKFGLDPSSRSKVSVLKKDELDPYEQYQKEKAERKKGPQKGKADTTVH